MAGFFMNEAITCISFSACQYKAVLPRKKPYVPSHIAFLR